LSRGMRRRARCRDLQSPPVHARFYAPEARRAGDVVLLPVDEAQHLVRVLRLGTGAAVRVFNGRGDEFDGVVERSAKDAVGVRLGNRREAASAEPRVAVTLAPAVLKGDKMDDVVRDAVMMGVAAIQPIVTARSEMALAALHKARRRERWERIAIASAKQCGRAVVPSVLEPIGFEAVLRAMVSMSIPGPGLMFVEPGAAADSLSAGEIDPAPPREVTVVLGPEGGWTPEEIDRGAGACRLVRLGGRTLRADAMPIVALAALFTRWNEF
jgi:16S rRNA (uracil1498-N3)-methyltransferase